MSRRREPHAVLTEDVVRDVFGLECSVIVDPVSGRPLMLPIGRHRVMESFSVR